MRQVRSEGRRRVEFGAEAERLHERLHEWRRANPTASFDEIAEAVSQERKRLMDSLIGELATQEGGASFERLCAECGGMLIHKGKKKRVVLHREADVELERDYYYCPACAQGIFPPGQETGAESSQLESGDDAHGAAAGGGDRLV